MLTFFEGNWKSRKRETETGTGTGNGNGKQKRDVALGGRKERMLLESACEVRSGKRVNPVQPLGSCGAKLSSRRQGWSTYVDSAIDKQ